MKLLCHPNDKGHLGDVESIQISLESPQMESAPVTLELLSILALLPGGVTWL